MPGPLEGGLAESPPEIDLDSAPYWEGLRRHVLLLQRCGACDRWQFPPLPRCAGCGSKDVHFAEASGRGTVYSYVRVHAAISTVAVDALPYTIATVELEEGPRILGRVVPDAPVEIGLGVRAFYVDHDSWSELRFAAR